jgi:hypothetical protein
MDFPSFKTAEFKRYFAYQTEYWSSKEVRSQFLDPPSFDFYYNATSDRKAWAHFQRVIRTEYYLRTLTELRKKYKITLHDNEYQPTPGKEYPPTDLRALKKDIIEKLGGKFGLSNAFLELVERDVFGVPDISVLENQPVGACAVVDRTDAIKKNDSKHERQHEIDCYPIAINISPYATKRDILDYVERAYKSEIQSRQKRHQIAGSPQKNIHPRMRRPLNSSLADIRQERADFIYRHRHLSLSALASELYGTFEVYKKPNIFHLDQGTIGKLLSIERKRREV